ncbi:hypothetical protein MPSEU_000774700 [Mayamaea pseudoterrestris]|nr:hypothetical protein MPSEU_000774700 [Mayamaea pseudoterrestris]
MTNNGIFFLMSMMSLQLSSQGVANAFQVSHSSPRDATLKLLAQSAINTDDESNQASGKRPSTSLPPRSKKKNGPKNKKKWVDSSNAANPSEEGFSDFHVSQYLRGSSNLFRKMKMEGDYSGAAASSTSCTQSLDGRTVLVLNADYQPMSYLPLSLWHWQEAVKAVFAEKVTVVDVYPNITIRSANVAVRLPSVIALRDYVPTQKYLHKHSPAFTKRNVFLRDEYRCQYCNVQFNSKDLSLDHVLPRCLGGRLNWENSVACCKICNGRKGSLTLKEISRVGMKLSRPPFVPSQFELSRIAASMLLPRKVHATWHPYLGIIHESAAVNDNSHWRSQDNGPPGNMAQVLLADEGYVA